jgi:hypothetical protein
VEGTELPMIDLFQMAGKDNAYTGTVQVIVTDGLLTIVFTAVGNNAKVSGLEIVQSGTAAPRVIAPTCSPVQAPSAPTAPLGKWIPATISSPGFKPRLNHCFVYF